MNKNDEIIFNLLIMAFGGYQLLEYMNTEEYFDVLEHSIFFKVTKDCFPENEITIDGYWKEASQVNYIKEV